MNPVIDYESFESKLDLKRAITKLLEKKFVKHNMVDGERYATVFFLRIIHDMTFVEIGKELNISHERARQVYNIALSQLKTLYGLGKFRRRGALPGVKFKE